ncbi:aminodeoxychorismate synthase component I [Massilia sp. S19_KUP03_FR1]|uniref:aminodeoxychorismate synthase component I n=1 Tax=Massilia sp. S19_KUP03_FR1 TaxID=3025503 RepID=UPI002FCD9BDC
MDTVFALLEESGSARSRLYTGHAGTLRCDDANGWPALLANMQTALQRGLYAVPVLTYELGAQLLGIPAQAPQAPLAQVLLFSSCDRLDTDAVQTWLSARTTDTSPAGIAALRASVDEAEFTAAIDRIRSLIAAGDTYQVNYTYRIRFDAFGSVFALYSRLRARQPVPYGALIGLPDGGAVLSFSPELFVRLDGATLTARPMKGTAPASDDATEDARRAAALATDPKNRAENLMIVDLLRNDLGRIAQTGSVTVPKLFDVQRFGAVLQMTTTVQAQLRPDVTLTALFGALYPCGSITGAPKQRTMEIISALESAPRGIYTGAIGWFDPARPDQAIGDFCLSVPIRTLALRPLEHGVRRGELGVGAGIVYDSAAASEFEECKLKARFLTSLPNTFEIFETLRADSEDGYRHLALHLARLTASSDYFGFPCDIDQARALLEQTRLGLAPGQRHRVRLALGAHGAWTVQSAPIKPLHEPVRVVLARETTDSSDLFLRHKTSVRSVYDTAWRDAEAQGAFDALFFNERGELTEGGRSNVFVRVEENWYTPPLACGVLPGVMRAVLLDAPAWRAREKVITLEMFDEVEDIVVCNALRGPLRAFL